MLTAWEFAFAALAELGELPHTGLSSSSSYLETGSLPAGLFIATGGAMVGGAIGGGTLVAGAPGAVDPLALIASSSSGDTKSELKGAENRAKYRCYTLRQTRSRKCLT